MFNSPRKSLPTLDYVSIVKSVYQDRRAMLVGMGATILAVLMTALKTDAPVLWAHVVAFGVLTFLRDRNVVAFARAAIPPDDRTIAEVWERRATIFGVATSALYGSWCFCAFVLVGDPFAQLTAMSVTIAAMIGIATRNFGIDRLVTLQSVTSAGLLGLGLALVGDVYYVLLALLLVPLIISFRSLAGDVREMLLNAVHERIAASSLADQLDTALDTMQHGLCMLDRNGVIALANDRAQQTFAELAQGAWVGRTFADLIGGAVARSILPRTTADRVLAMISDGAGGKVVLRLSDDFHCEVTISTRQDRTVLLFENVTARVRAQERINYMARYDGLTGLPNRIQFTEMVDADLASRRRQRAPEPAMLMIVDLDDFKHINDTLGHLAGDSVLAEAARRIQTVAHRDSQIARFGGDEFVIYRARRIAGAPAGGEASAILKALSRPYDVDGERLEVNASAGLVRVAQSDATLDDLISRADLALYHVKARGKGQWFEFEDKLDVEYRYRQRLKSDLRDAIAREDLSLVFQPLVEMRTGKVAACEALVRWTHPELGPISPNVFIPLAEDMGVVSEITRYVLFRACAECVRWPAEIPVSVNVSGRDLRSDLVSHQITEALATSGLPADRLEIEVTETALIEEREKAADRLKGLAARGIGLALDDFGTGYSSLSYLHELPFTKLKIDRSFLVDIAHSANALALLANVARLGNELGLLVTAEGVETQDQLDLIAGRTGIDQVQGFLFGMPLPAPEIGALIASMGRSPLAPELCRVNQKS